MSVTPEPGSGLAARGPETQTVPEAPSSAKVWQRRLLRLCFALFAFEIGLFLVIFPWSERWDLSYFQDFSPKIQDFWDEPAFRGAITGLGLTNIYIALLQVFRSFRKH